MLSFAIFLYDSNRMELNILIFIVILFIIQLLKKQLIIPCGISHIFHSQKNVYLFIFISLYITIFEFDKEHNNYLDYLYSTIIIFMLYIMLLRMNPYCMFISIILFYILYRIEQYYKEKKKEQYKNYINISKIILLCFVIGSFLAFIGAKSREFGSRFDWTLFFNSSVYRQCSGTPNKFLISDIPIGIKRIIKPHF